MAATGLQMAAINPAGQMGMAAAVGTGQPQLQQSLSMSSSVPAGTLPPTPGAQPVAVGVPYQAASGGNFTSGSLYVGDLHTDVTETMLYDKFKDCGAILSIRLCRDVVTRRSLGYAYVNFANAADAERALDTMNFDIVKGRPIRIMWSQRDPSIRRSGVGNIFIKNLDKSIDNKALYDTFSAFGSILSCKISMDADGTSRGFGFVHFETEEAARMAIEKVDGMLLNGKKVFVGEFKQRKDRPDEAAARYKNCFVKNFGDYLDDTTLQELFEKYGDILSAKVMTDDDGKSRGFGFVAFKDHDSAQVAVSDLNGKEIDSNGRLAVKSESAEEGAGDAKPFKKIFVGRAMKKLERLQAREMQRNKLREERLRKYNGANIFVKNLVDDIDDEKLNSQFTAFGEITSARVMKDMHGRSRGFGFVCYSNPDEANNAIKEMNGKMIAGKPIYVALAQLKVDRQAQLQQRFLSRMITEQRQGLAGQAGFQLFANQQGMQPLPFSPTGGPAAARFPFQRPQRYQMPMGARPQMNTGLMINPLTGLPAGMNAGQMAGLAAGYPALGGLPGAAANGQFGQQLNASFSGRQPNWNPATMGQRGAAGGGPGRPGQMAQAMAQAANAQNQLLNNQRALTGAGGVNPLVQKQTAEQQALLKVQQAAAASINLANAPPALVQQLKQAQQTGLASADVIRFLSQSQNPVALAQAPVPALQQPVATDSTQELARQLASAAPGEQKQILGEKLYPLIHDMYPQLAGKITGMLLEMDNSELLHMLEAPEVLHSKVTEAFDVLKQHQMDGSQAATAQPGGLLTTAAKEPGSEA